MYKLIRRISSSFFPRPDRPWSEDATSSAPQIGRKRRLSTTEPDEPSPSVKKLRAESPDSSDDASQRDLSPSRSGKETEEVKEVTKGVKEVELEEGSHPDAEAPADAATVPLPDSPVHSATQGAEEAPGATAPPMERPSSTEPIVIKETTASQEEPAELAEGKAIDVKADIQSEAVGEEEIPGLSSSAENKSLGTVQTGVDSETNSAKDGSKQVGVTPEQTSSGP